MNQSITAKVTTCSQKLPGYSVLLACAFFLGATLNSVASTITLNFDSVGASIAPVDPAAYLASYGITLSGVSPSNPMIFSDTNFYGSGVVKASSGDNFLLQQSAVYGGNFTLNFSDPLVGLDFTRIQNLTSNLVGSWTATAYSGATALSSVGEGFGQGSFSAANYSFVGGAGMDITSLTITGSGYGVAGISSVMIDDLVLTTRNSVPDESSTLVLLMLGVSMVALRRKFGRR